MKIQQSKSSVAKMSQRYLKLVSRRVLIPDESMTNDSMTLVLAGSVKPVFVVLVSLVPGLERTPGLGLDPGLDPSARTPFTQQTDSCTSSSRDRVPQSEG